MLHITRRQISLLKLKEFTNRLPYIDKTEAEMTMLIDKYAAYDYTSYGCLIIFIMSHGDKSKIISSDSEIIDLNEFITPLKRNASLKSKPKVFFIQACRGGNTMSANDGNRTAQSSSSIFLLAHF